MQPLDILRAGDSLGEGLVWDSRRRRLWWTDIAGRRLHCLHDDGRREILPLAQRAASLALVEGSEQLLVAFADQLALFDPMDGQHQTVWKLPQDSSGVRLNDGRVDRAGRFCCASMVEDGSGLAKASLYQLERGALRTLREGVHIGNGLAFSLDGRTLYFADSARHAIWRHALDEDGRLGPPVLFAQTPARSFPDGATVDSEDCLWIAHWGGAQVARYTPQGRLDRVVSVPVTQPSCVCFGGTRRDLLFVSSARIGLAPEVLAREPHAGDVFVYRVGISGVEEPEYRR